MQKLKETLYGVLLLAAMAFFYWAVTTSGCVGVEYDYIEGNCYRIY